MKMQMQHKLSAAERRREKKENEGERETERESEWRVLSPCSPHSIWPLSVAATSATDRMSCRVHAVSWTCSGVVAH